MDLVDCLHTDTLEYNIPVKSDILDPPISALEVNNAVKQLKCGNASGRHGIGSEFYKYADNLLLIRLSSHKFHIGYGRYTKPVPPVELRTCNNCSLGCIEDEIRVLLECTAYSTQRDVLFYNENKVILGFLELDKVNKNLVVYLDVEMLYLSRNFLNFNTYAVLECHVYIMYMYVEQHYYLCILQKMIMCYVPVCVCANVHNYDQSFLFELFSVYDCMHAYDECI